MSKPERKAFFDKNFEAMDSLLERSNVKRGMNNQPPVSQLELDKAIDELIAMKAGENEIGAFVFPAPPPGTPPVRSKAPEAIQGDRLNFEITKIENGFVLSGGGKSYIFKTREELSSIFDGMLFTKWIVDEDAVENPSLIKPGGVIIVSKRGRPKKEVSNGR